METGSFTAASKMSNTSTAQTSRCIADLEMQLGARLLHRTTRRVSVTELGKRFFVRSERILHEFENAKNDARDTYATPTGKLRVHSMTSIGIMPLVARYMEKYPLVNVDLTLQQRIPDLLEEGFDVSIVRTISLANSSYVSRLLGSSYSIACASPDYLGQRQAPETLANLDDHLCLHLMTPSGPLDKWSFQGPVGLEEYHLKSPRLRVNQPEALLSGILLGTGIGILPAHSIVSELAAGRLIRILPDYRCDEQNIYALYPSRNFLDAKIRSWVDFLCEEVPEVLQVKSSIVKPASLTLGWN